ncbi:MAG: BT4734/BF3469 family protein [Paludibacter sp.]|nr:BT4734/BF3469 family protein [Paludibacter sp.]
MIDLTDRLNEKVSFQKNAFASLSHELKISDVLRGIKEERLKYIVTNLREMIANGDIDSYGNHKKKLPGVTFSGTFNEKRRRNNLKTYNRIIVLDVDKLTSIELEINKKILQEDPYVISFWESPSKMGLKGLVYLDYNLEITDFDFFHRIAFKKLVEYFQSNYKIELDESGSDTTRLCFLSSDANIVIKDDCSKFLITQQDIEYYSPSLKSVTSNKEKGVRKTNKKDALLNASGKNSPKYRLTIKSIIKFLSKRDLSITNTYDKWYRIAFAIANSFSHDIGEEYFLKLCQQDKEKYDEIECRNLLINCYETTNSEIKFSTIFYYAQEIGYKQKSNKGDGSEGV